MKGGWCIWSLAGNENVKTESIGEGEERKVVIRPVGELEKLEKLSTEA